MKLRKWSELNEKEKKDVVTNIGIAVLGLIVTGFGIGCYCAGVKDGVKVFDKCLSETTLNSGLMRTIVNYGDGKTTTIYYVAGGDYGNEALKRLYDYVSGTAEIEWSRNPISDMVDL